MIRVTAAIIRDGGQVLITRRTGSGDPLAGKWEFPGGKIEEGESPEVCLSRELREELGVAVCVGEPLGSVVHTYPRGTIELLFYAVTIVSGSLSLKAHDRYAWVRPAEMSGFDFAPADLPMVNQLTSCP
jgi:8-oxo-dGTP diphosphatase